MAILLRPTLLIRSSLIFQVVLTDHEKFHLTKDLKLAIPLKDISYADYILPFQLLCRDTDSLMISNFD